MASKKNTAKLPLDAISRGVLHVSPGRFYLKKGETDWVGAAHKPMPLDEAQIAIAQGRAPYLVDDRAYIEFRGPETNEGRAAMRAYVDLVGTVDKENAQAANDFLTARAVDLICAMTTAWRLFDDDGQPIDFEPQDHDAETGKTQIRILTEHFVAVAPRKILEIAGFLRNLKNFQTVAPKSSSAS